MTRLRAGAILTTLLLALFVLAGAMGEAFGPTSHTGRTLAFLADTIKDGQ